jgi:hypothetical protein
LNGPGLSLSVVWQDESLVEISIAAVGERATCTAEIYTDYDALRNVAALLVGFPISDTDTRAFAHGSKGVGHCECRLTRYDRSGHTVMSVEIEAPHVRKNVYEFTTKVLLEIEFEAACLDEFRVQLTQLVERRSGTATLCGVSVA